MADGDERVIATGPFAGNTLRIINVAAGTTNVPLVPARADKRPNLVAGLLKSSGAAADLAIVESGVATELMLWDAADGEAIGIEPADDIRAATAGNGLELTRSASTAIAGYVVFNRN